MKRWRSAVPALIASVGASWCANNIPWWIWGPVMLLAGALSVSDWARKESP